MIRIITAAALLACLPAPAAAASTYVVCPAGTVLVSSTCVSPQQDIVCPAGTMLIRDKCRRPRHR